MDGERASRVLAGKLSERYRREDTQTQIQYCPHVKYNEWWCWPQDSARETPESLGTWPSSHHVLWWFWSLIPLPRRPTMLSRCQGPFRVLSPLVHCRAADLVVFSKILWNNCSSSVWYGFMLKSTHFKLQYAESHLVVYAKRCKFKLPLGKHTPWGKKCWSCILCRRL